MPTPPATTSSTSSSAPGACAYRRWPYTTFARDSASIAPRGPRRPPPNRMRHARPPNRARSQWSRRASPCHCRLPLFLDADPVRGRVPVDAASLGLVDHGRAMFRGRWRLLAARSLDQRLLLGGRHGTRLPSGRDERRGLRPAVRRPPRSVAPRGGGLAAAPALVRGRCL